MREFPCKLIRVVNGNTVEAEFDLCFDLFTRINIRLFGIGDTNEAMTFLINMLPSEFTCRTTYNKRSKRGRCLGYIYILDDDGNEININDIMVANGLAIDVE